jgi:hypothetical protein
MEIPMAHRHDLPFSLTRAAAFAVAVFALAARASAQLPDSYTYRFLLDDTTALPGGGTLTGAAALSNNGIVAFTGTNGQYVTGGANIVRLVAFGTAAPGGGTYASVGTPRVSSVNNHGVVAFTGQVNLAGNTPVASFASNGTGGRLLGREGSPAPDGGNYQFLYLAAFPPQINNNGVVAYAGNTNLNPALMLANDGTTTRIIAQPGQAAPGGGTFALFDENNLNDAGDFAFHASLNGGPGFGIYKFGANGVNQRLVARGDAAPGGGTFNSPVSPDINESGFVSFRSTLTGGPAQGVYRTNGVNTVRILATGETAPGGEVVQRFNSITNINNSGLVSFYTLTTATGPQTLSSLYVGDGTGVRKVIGIGDSLFGSVVTALGGGYQYLNDAGQVLVSYTLQNGRTGLALANPVLPAASAPEPATFTLVTLVLVGAGRRRRVAPGH